MKISLTLALSLLALHSFAQFDTSGPINKQVVNTVIEIEKGKETGSGFLVFLGQKRLLVTNKHMIGSWSPVDSLIYSDSIYIYPYTKSGFVRIGIKIANLGVPIKTKVKVHPNQKVDIAVVDISSDIFNVALDNTNFVDTTYFVTLEKVKDFLTYGSQVFTIGYPAGVKSFKTNQPLIKSGYIASSLDGDLVMEQNWANRKGTTIRTLTDGKIFIVDGLIIPGNSGGPVVLSQEVVWFVINGQLKHLKGPKNYFIGIVSNIYTNTGLTTIFSSDNILEVIRKFN
jgi:S1-C subfamily serine protease